MKIVPLHQITNKGYKLELNDKETWLTELLDSIFPNKNIDMSSISGSVELKATDQIIDYTGHLKFTHHPLCAHCGNTLKVTEDINYQYFLSPLNENEKKNKHKENQKEIKLTPEDLEANFYDHDEIRVGEILNDEIALHLSYNYYCAKKDQCKQVLPPDPHITLNDTTDPRWLALKNLKTKNK